jgi:flagellar biosynthesis anti-sigma factor FlgM
MGISKIGSLFAANVDSLSTRSQNRKNPQSESPEAVTPSPDGDAVVFSSSLDRGTPEGSETTRADKIAQLKSQVSRGQYSVDSEKVALAVYRDLA